MKKIEDNNTLVSQTHCSLHAGRTHLQRPMSSFYVHCLQAQLCTGYFCLLTIHRPSVQLLIVYPQVFVGHAVIVVQVNAVHTAAGVLMPW